MTDTEAVNEAAGHAEEAFDPGATIMHHILDSHELEVPFTQITIPLPEIHLLGIDLSITKHVVMMWIVSAILLTVFTVAARQVTRPVPGRLRNMLEVMIVYIRDEVGRKAIGKGHEHYTGYLLTTFFFILTCNLLGLIPGMATATGNISVTATMAILAFIMYQYSGIRIHGFVQHYKNLVPSGLPMWLVPMMFVLEFLSLFIRAFALCVRLFANMMAGHVVILAFISLIFILGAVSIPVAIGFALFVHLLEVLIGVLQAYIFTMLTASFIGMSAHPAH
jgi:F-type H+-transporting ATPase subunit a